MFIPKIEYDMILEYIPIICVDLLILNDGKCLLLKRDNEPAMGQYWFPGGRINKLESIKDAALRKAKEETNLDCEFIKIVTIEETIFLKNEDIHADVHTVNICCQLGTATIAPLQIDEYHEDFKWVNQQSDSYHKSVNRPLSLIGFESEEQDISS